MILIFEVNIKGRSHQRDFLQRINRGKREKGNKEEKEQEDKEKEKEFYR